VSTRDVAASARLPEPFRKAFAELAKAHGDVALVDACAQLVGVYARRGARAALLDRKGDDAIACPRCRERDAHIRQIEETTRRVSRPVTQGAAAGAPAADEG
jgi:hypothetical protein